MSWLPSFTVWQFAAAGAIAATGPVIIHLLNRRRYKVVQWAAMDFLREAMQRNRRILQIRDILLLLLRCAAVLLFGMALARPFFSSGEREVNDRIPLHGILVVDNSLSMSYETLEGTLLDRAKSQAKQFIEKLPSGSRISVIPACGSVVPYSVDPYASPEAAAEAIDRIGIVDRSASINRVANEAMRSRSAVPELESRIVFFGDQQQTTWQGLSSVDQFKDLPAMQVVNIAPDSPENTWISDLRIQDGLADVETPTKFVVDVRHQGDQPRNDVQVSLWVDGAEVGTKTVTLEPGPGVREVDFDYLFSSYQPDSSHPIFVPVKATIAPDKLVADDERFLAAPVVASLPVVFIDQYGAEDEDPAKNRLGETRHLRKLLAPIVSRSDSQRQLVKVRHLSADQLNQEAIADARVVVIAGLSDLRAESVKLLRDYVQQGGQLLIGAGANFDPDAWNSVAWQGGEGILPLPLKREPIGQAIDESASDPKPFSLSFDSMGQNSYFRLAGIPENDLRDIYSDPLFFKAVEVDGSDESLKLLHDSAAKSMDTELRELAEIDSRDAEFARLESDGKLSEEQRRTRTADQIRRRELRPQWLAWTAAAEFAPEPELPSEEAARQKRIEEVVAEHAPQVLARFTSERGPAFLVERSIGRGRVMFCSTGLLSAWNTLPKTNAIVMFDRILRDMIGATLPGRNFGAVDQLTLPLPREDHDVVATLLRPSSAEPEPVDVGAIGADARGVTLHGLVERGFYRVSAKAPVAPGVAASGSASQAEAVPLWEVPIAVNGDPQESELASLGEGRFDELAADSKLRWVEEGSEISLAGTAIRGQGMWWYLTLAVFLLLLAEMLTLAWPNLKPILVPSTQVVAST